MRPKNSELETHANKCKRNFKKKIYIEITDKGIVNSKKPVPLEHMLIYLHLHNRNQSTN